MACLTSTEGCVCLLLAPVLSLIECISSWPARAQCERVSRARPVVAVSGLDDEVLQSSAAQQWTSQLYPRPPGERGPLGAGRWGTCGTRAGSSEWVDCKRLS